jgi:RimJ/RimL family protein N-acetyltransferase
MAQEVDGIQELEVGYHIFKKYWGHGYAPEAARLFWTLLSTMILLILLSLSSISGTSKSMRVADKNGLRREKQTRWMDLDVFIYRVHG